MSFSFDSLLSKGITDESCVHETQAIRLFNSSVISTVVLGAVFTVVFYFFNLKVAALIYGLCGLFFLVSYFAAGFISRDFLSLLNSCVMSLVNISAFTYYGATYGFQYLFLISLVVTIINTKSKKNRRIFYAVLLFYILASGSVLQTLGAQAPPTEYGNAINLGLIVFSLFVACHFMENFLGLEGNLKKDREVRLEALEKKNEEFKVFNYTVAHDLKEPLRSISSFSNLLYKNTSSRNLLESENYNQFISDGVTRMGKLLDDLMIYIESTDKTILYESVDLNHALDFALENLSQLIKDKEAKINKVNLPTIRANSTQCVLLFQNFLSNSIKFVDVGVIPEISITSRLRSEGAYVFIQDNGIGISPTDQNSIFDAFKRLNGRRKYKGSGLGLTLCKKIVDGFSGEISISSSKGNGTTFRIFIPAEFIEQNSFTGLYKESAAK